MHQLNLSWMWGALLLCPLSSPMLCCWLWSGEPFQENFCRIWCLVR